MLKPRDWTLLVVAAAEDTLEPVQLQKALFLASKSLPATVKGATFHKFRPYDYGPFSAEAYSDVEGLRDEGLVEIVAVPGLRYKRYRVTDSGRDADSSERRGTIS